MGLDVAYIMGKNSGTWGEWGVLMPGLHIRIYITRLWSFLPPVYDICLHGRSHIGDWGAPPVWNEHLVILQKPMTPIALFWQNPVYFPAIGSIFHVCAAYICHMSGWTKWNLFTL